MAEPSKTSRAPRAVRVGFGVLGLLVGAVLVVAFASGPAFAADLSLVGSGSSVGHVAAVAAPPVTTVPPTTAPGGTQDFNKGNKDADAALAKQKLILAVISVVLVVIVYFGHKAKYKHLWRLRRPQRG